MPLWQKSVFIRLPRQSATAAGAKAVKPESNRNHLSRLEIGEKNMAKAIGRMATERAGASESNQSGRNQTKIKSANTSLPTIDIPLKRSETLLLGERECSYENFRLS